MWATRGTHLQTDRRLEATPNQYLSTSAARDQETIDFLTANVASPFYPLLPGTQLAGSKIARERLLRPFPHFGNLRMMTDEGYSWYHALQAGVEKRFGQGYTLMLQLQRDCSTNSQVIDSMRLSHLGATFSQALSVDCPLGLTGWVPLKLTDYPRGRSRTVDLS